MSLYEETKETAQAEKLVRYLFSVVQVAGTVSKILPLNYQIYRNTVFS